MAKEKVIHLSYLCSLTVLLAGLPLSRFMLSLGQILLLLVWISDLIVNGNIKSRFKAFINNKPALVLISVYLLHVIGLLWTSNLDYGLHDLRIKLPLLTLPIIFATATPLSAKDIRLLFNIYIVANIVGVLLGCYKLWFTDFTDIRQIVWFNSHIRFSLNIVVAMMLCIWLQKGNSVKMKIPYILAFVIFLFFLLSLEAMTALGILCFIAGFYALKGIFFSRYKKVKWISGIAIGVFVLSITLLVYNIYRDLQPKESKELSSLDVTTVSGTPYAHDTASERLENGYWLNIYVAEPELRDAWNKRSSLDYDGDDLLGQDLDAVLKRYLTGKGLRKDAEGMAALSDEDIRNIEAGIANYHYADKSSLNNRIRVIFWEFHVWQCCNQIAGSSVVQRFEFWKAACHTIKNNFWFGVGTGDAADAQREAYKAINSSFPEKLQRRYHPHNQYLSIFAALGLFGFLWFLFSLFYPAIKLKRFSWFIYTTFFITIALSMLTEDTLETQAGVTFYAFFNSFLLGAGFMEWKDKGL